MKITLSTDIINAIDTSDPKIQGMIPPYNQVYYHGAAGQEHYKLLSYLSTLYNYEILGDIGTNTGASALALSHNPTNHVFSVDIVDHKQGQPLPVNCKYTIGNLLWDETIFDAILKCPLMLMDIDHEYHTEIQIYNRLVASSWKGVLICDDIHLNEPMKQFWSEVTHRKYDVTKYGHASGTGFIVTDDSIEIEMV